MPPLKPTLLNSNEPTLGEHELTRRRFVGAATLGAISAAGVSIASLIDTLVRAGAWAAGSDKPEKDEVRMASFC